VTQSRLTSTLKAKDWTFEAKTKAIGPENKVKAFKHTARAEIKIRSTCNNLTG